MPLTPTPFLTMADLDDALFALEGRLDFTAAASDDELRETVQAERDGIETAVQRALTTLPAVQVAGLAVMVQVQRSGLGQADKRKFWPSQDGY